MISGMYTVFVSPIAHHLRQPFLRRYHHQPHRRHPLNAPTPTLTSWNWSLLLTLIDCIITLQHHPHRQHCQLHDKRHVHCICITNCSSSSSTISSSLSSSTSSSSSSQRTNSDADLMELVAAVDIDRLYHHSPTSSSSSTLSIA